jgi:SAM-dependent methyltransferase
MLQDGQSRLGRSGRILYVAADLYRLPFAANAFDAGIMCRVIHHIADVPAALAQIRACFAGGGKFILEFANKRNLKAIARYALRQQKWNPHDLAPIEFVKLNFDFHPSYMRQALQAANFTSQRQLAVSWLRLGLFKKLLPLGAMVALDKALQPLGKTLPVSPSIFVENSIPGSNAVVADADLFVCPISRQPLHREGDLMVGAGGYRWAIHDGIYDFKTPV